MLIMIISKLWGLALVSNVNYDYQYVIKINLKGFKLILLKMY